MSRLQTARSTDWACVDVRDPVQTNDLTTLLFDSADRAPPFGRYAHRYAPTCSLPFLGVYKAVGHHPAQNKWALFFKCHRHLTHWYQIPIRSERTRQRIWFRAPVNSYPTVKSPPTSPSASEPMSLPSATCATSGADSFSCFALETCGAIDCRWLRLHSESSLALKRTFSFRGIRASQPIQ